MDGEAGWWTTSGKIGFSNPLARVKGVGRQQLAHYYRTNRLRANPDKTQVTAFHIKNKEAKRSLKSGGTILVC